MEFIYFLICIIQPIILFTPEMIVISSASIKLNAFSAFIIGAPGILIGIVIMYMIGRLGRETLVKKIIKEKKLERYTKYVQKNELLIISCLFILPILPDNVICAGAGVSKVPFKKFMLIASPIKILTTLFYAYIPELFNEYYSYYMNILIVIIILTIIILSKKKIKFYL